MWDPPDGRLPPLSAEAQNRASQPSFTGRGDDAPEDRSPAERCVGATCQILVPEQVVSVTARYELSSRLATWRYTLNTHTREGRLALSP